MAEKLTVNLGGDRLGSGAKMDIDMKTYNRSTHDLGYIWRNTQAPGTLVPFMSMVALPGDTFDIDLDANVLTLPTVGPLFGTFKLQLDIFRIPIRLYNKALHDNKVGIGLDMSVVKLPIMKVTTENLDPKNKDDWDYKQIHPSSLLAYLGVRGNGWAIGAANVEKPVAREYNAIPFIGYWDIYKNYYSNKQEEKGAFLDNRANVAAGGEVMPRVQGFDLKNIDKMRDIILKQQITSPLLIGDKITQSYVADEELSPYTEGFKLQDATKGKSYWSYNQQGLGLKTYQSDLFNNWMNYEWIAANNGSSVNGRTAVDVSIGEFTIDQLNLANKVYNLLNRIAASGGTYNDWLETVYTHDNKPREESPVYEGGLSKEIVFQEVISNAATETTEAGESPLGTLAGKGRLSDKHKGGQVTIRVNEPSYIMGIVSITPRIDYSQGNNWDMFGLKTMDDLHKPALDGIGFQDLVTDQMAAWSTSISGANVNYKTIGKVPAWINYMTNFNKCYGNFALKDNQMFMTLNRKYTPKAGESTNEIEGLTTYINPEKFNYAFAQTDLTSQNFWVQIGCDIKARRKMSAKIIPNL